MTKILKLLLPLCAFFISSCGTLAPGFGVRDQYVINTPRYFDNRVFYVASSPKNKVWLLEDAFTARTSADDKTHISHGSALSIILNSVTMPPPDTASGGKPKWQGTRDIAVVLDVTTKATGANESIVAWYQRGVQPDQALNFSNLLLYFDPRWDARVAPLIRIRVVDVTLEKNAEVREALGQIKQFTNSIGPILPNSSQSLVSVATRAASLILSRPNEQLLDYTVQFYSEEQLAESYGSDLTPLRRGRVLLIGRPKDQSRSYWHGFNGSYDGETLIVQNGSNPVVSPAVLITVSTAQAVVPMIVSARSAYLQKLLADAQQGDTTAVAAAGRSVWDGVRTYALLEELRRSRDQDSLTAVYDAYDDTGNDTKLGTDDRALLRQTLRNISECSLMTDADIKAWWSNNNSALKFKKDNFKLEGEKCGS